MIARNSQPEPGQFWQTSLLVVLGVIAGFFLFCGAAVPVLAPDGAGHAPSGAMAGQDAKHRQESVITASRAPALTSALAPDGAGHAPSGAMAGPDGATAGLKFECGGEEQPDRKAFQAANEKILEILGPNRAPLLITIRCGTGDLPEANVRFSFNGRQATVWLTRAELYQFASSLGWLMVHIDHESDAARLAAKVHAAGLKERAKRLKKVDLGSGNR